MLASFQTFLYRYTGQDDICIGALVIIIIFIEVLFSVHRAQIHL